jgi:hypothetical protein
VGFGAFEKPFAAANAHWHTREREFLCDGLTVNDKDEIKTIAFATQNDTTTDTPRLKPAFAAPLVLRGYLY